MPGARWPSGRFRASLRGRIKAVGLAGTAAKQKPRQVEADII